jgi:hypothetical protein
MKKQRFGIIVVSGGCIHKKAIPELEVSREKATKGHTYTRKSMNETRKTMNIRRNPPSINQRLRKNAMWKKSCTLEKNISSTSGKK